MAATPCLAPAATAPARIVMTTAVVMHADAADPCVLSMAELNITALRKALNIALDGVRRRVYDHSCDLCAGARRCDWHRRAIAEADAYRRQLTKLETPH